MAAARGPVHDKDRTRRRRQNSFAETKRQAEGRRRRRRVTRSDEFDLNPEVQFCASDNLDFHLEVQFGPTMPEETTPEGYDAEAASPIWLRSPPLKNLPHAHRFCLPSVEQAERFWKHARENNAFKPQQDMADEEEDIEKEEEV